MLVKESAYLYINIAVILLYVSFVILGYIKGLFYELISLVYTGVSLFIAWLISPVFAELFPIVKMGEIYDEGSILNNIVNVNPLINTALYFLIVFIVLKIAYIIISLVVKSFNKLPVLGTFNKILGAIFGIINATLITLLISIFFTLPLFKNGNEVRKNTILNYVDSISNQAIKFVVDHMDTDFIVHDVNFDASKTRQDITNWLINHE